MYKSVLLFSLSLFAFACSSNQSAVKDYQDDFIQFGEYGGFAGTYIEHQVLADGRVFSRANEKAKFISMESVSKESAQRIFDNYESLKIGEIQVSDPGNLTKFVKAKINGKTIKQEWGGNVQQFDLKLKAYYNGLKNTVKGKNPTQ